MPQNQNKRVLLTKFTQLGSLRSELLRPASTQNIPFLSKPFRLTFPDKPFSVNPPMVKFNCGTCLYGPSLSIVIVGRKEMHAPW